MDKQEEKDILSYRETEELIRRINALCSALEGKVFKPDIADYMQEIYSRLMESRDLVKEIQEEIICNTSLAQVIEDKDFELMKEIEKRANAGQRIRIM